MDAYEEALERQPDLQPALTNKALVEQLLQQRQQPATPEQKEPEPGEEQQSAQPIPGDSGENDPQNHNQSETAQPGEEPGTPGNRTAARPGRTPAATATTSR